MTNIDRRTFLGLLSGAVAFGLVGRAGTFGIPEDPTPYEVLVIGDSLIWGQGLLEKDKTYTHIANWLRKDILTGIRTVDVKVKAHSGATIKLDPQEAASLNTAKVDPTIEYKGEVNIGFPSIWQQVDKASSEYGPTGAHLILLTAGITDITVEGVLDPFGKEADLKKEIATYCGGQVTELLGHIGKANPNATIVVLGYYPIITKQSRASRVFNGWLESRETASFLKPIFNNALTRTLFFSRIRKKVIKRSKVWLEDSNYHLRMSVETHNRTVGSPKAIFVASPLTEDNAVEAPNTKLFRMKKNGDIEDPLFAERTADCAAVLNDLNSKAKLKYRPSRCAMAAVGHPDPNGAAAYAEAVKAALKPLFAQK
jgi:lysophospholipase L1-like esterase